MIAVVILGIAAAVAVPSFLNMIQRNQVASATNDLLATMLAARSEAVKQEADIVVTESGGWSAGWVVEDADGNQLVSHTTSHNDIVITGSGAAVDGVTYRGNGRAAMTEDDYFTITLEDETRCLVFSVTGRPSVGECP